MNAGFQWIKSHKGISAAIAGGIFIILYLFKSSSSSSASSASGSYGVSGNDLSFLQIQAGTQQAAINANAATSIAQIQGNTEIAGINASQEVTDEQTQAQLQATVAGYNTAQQIVTTQTGAEEDLEGQVINAGLTEEENQQSLASSELGYVNNINGSQNRLALLQSIIGQPQAAAETEASEGQIQSQPNPFLAGLGNALGSIGSGLLGGLFGAKPATVPVTSGSSVISGYSIPTTSSPVTSLIPYQQPQNYTVEFSPSYS